MKVVIVAEYYPRAGHPVLGVWAHRQALAARAAGAEIRVLVLHRPLPSFASLRARDLRAAAAAIRQPASATLDGLEVRYIRYLSPPRPWSYGSWGAWAAPALGRALRELRSGFAADLIHAHYAVPAADAVRRASPSVPLVVSVHSHDPLGGGGDCARRALGHARLVIANSAGTAQRCVAAGARSVRVVHLGTDLPAERKTPPREPTLVSVGHLVARKRHADVIAAVALLREAHPQLRYVIIGDGPERERLRTLAASLGVADRVSLRGQLAPADAIAGARAATLFVLPSVDEAFGVAYVEAMAGAVPAVACEGEDGPEEIAASGGGIVRVPPCDPPALARRISELLADEGALEALGRDARETVEREFTWERCGDATLAAYRAAAA